MIRLVLVRFLRTGPLLWIRGVVTSIAGFVYPSPRLNVFAARIYDRIGNFDACIRACRRAATTARRSGSAESVRYIHMAEFLEERALWQTGRGRVSDPLFGSLIHPVSDGENGGRGGYYRVFTDLRGVRIKGVRFSRRERKVHLSIDGTRVRSINVNRRLFSGAFQFLIKRSGVATFPQSCILTVESESGVRLAAIDGGNAYRLSVPHGDGSILNRIRDGSALTKKGTPVLSTTEISERHQSLLRLYDMVNRFLEREVGKSLCLMYGTLLGFYRDGAIIPGDDDFDVAYISDYTDPAEVKREVLDIIRLLVRNGFSVGINRRGRPCRVGHPSVGTLKVHLDMRPLWFQDGYAWAHNHFRMPAQRETFLPLAKGTLQGTPVRVPRDTESFLRFQYGEGWRVPDPGFRYYREKMDPAIFRTVDRLIISGREFETLAAELDTERREGSGYGSLVSYAAINLYPLEISEVTLE